ncbi:MAG: hypothetical protein PF637_14915 [Spirochaetes bacterium]|jgi:hypothetical protein|nr:hypothetical protein [Spirochaetota bacterium]
MKNLFATLLLCLSIVALIPGEPDTPTTPAPTINYAHAGFGEALDSLKTSLERTEEFVTRVYSTIESITSFTGFKTIIILILAFILSSGISTTGIARGKNVFFLSLLIIDILWFLWFSVFYDTRKELIQDMSKTNLMILSPFILILLVKFIAPQATRFIRSFNRKNVRTKRFCIKNWNEFNLETSNFTSLYNSDIHMADENVVISSGTESSAKKLMILLKELTSRDKII